MTDEVPRRVVVDKYRTSSSGNGEPFTALSFDDELQDTRIIYGTLDEVDANREGAMLLQQVLQRREHNIIVPVLADREVTEEELKNHHLVLIGHPGTNAIAARFSDQIPIRFGSHSFAIRGNVYANPESSVLVGVENPLNRRFSLALFAGLGTRATITLVNRIEDDRLAYAPVILLPAGQPAQNLVLAPNELVREFPRDHHGK